MLLYQMRKGLPLPFKSNRLGSNFSRDQVASTALPWRTWSRPGLQPGLSLYPS